MTKEQLEDIEKDAARRDEATATILLLVKAVREAKAEIERYRRSLAQQEDMVDHFEPRAYSACLQPPEGCQCAGCDYRREWVRS